MFHQDIIHEGLCGPGCYQTGTATDNDEQEADKKEVFTGPDDRFKNVANGDFSFRHEDSVDYSYKVGNDRVLL